MYVLHRFGLCAQWPFSSCLAMKGWCMGVQQGLAVMGQDFPTSYMNRDVDRGVVEGGENHGSVFSHLSRGAQMEDTRVECEGSLWQIRGLKSDDGEHRCLKTFK
ncbi:hypothetical protein CsSME_00042154 [Camellia sinensis var. sinensis]